jgi:hypothetical protein
MKVVNLSYSDYANFGYYNAMALRSVGIEADAYTTIPHVFGYANQAQVVNQNLLPRIMDKADVIQIMHSDRMIFRYVHHRLKTKSIRPVKIIVWHTGTRYRQFPERYNELFNPYVDKSIIALGEFEKLGAKNMEYIAPCINTDEFVPGYGVNQPIVIGHFPSNPDVKGTESIKAVVQKLQAKYPNAFHFDYSVQRVGYEEQKKRMQRCDIYVEMCNNYQKGKTYGSWGTTALEAAAMGKVVVTNHLHIDLYERNYGSCKLFVANSMDALFKELEFLILCHPSRIINFKKASRQWVEEKHSYKATGERMKKILFENELVNAV